MIPLDDLTRYLYLALALLCALVALHENRAWMDSRSHAVEATVLLYRVVDICERDLERLWRSHAEVVGYWRGS